MARRPKVLVGTAVDEDAVKPLRELADVDFVKEASIQTKEGLMRIIGDYDAAIVAVPPFDREVLSMAPRLRVISRVGVGFDTVDVRAAVERGIRVAITPVLSETVAETTFALMLAAARKIPQAHIYVTGGRWRKRTERDLFMGVDLFRKVLGIIGLGRIGSVVAKRGRAFEMTVLYYDMVRRPELEAEGVGYRKLDGLLAEADFLSVNVPLTGETTGMIGERELRLMKKTAILVNTSRGAVIDEKALCVALKEGWIAAAALDVFEEEPISPDSPLLTLDNVVLTPHIGGATVECRRRCIAMAVENTVRVLKGEPPLHSAV